MNSEPKKPETSQRSKRLVAWAIVGGVILIVAILLVTYGLGGVMQGFQRVQPPNVQVTSQNLRTGNIGLDYVAWVDVSVHNSGGPGTVTVWVEIAQGSDMWKKSQTIYLDAKGSRSSSNHYSDKNRRFHIGNEI